MMMLLLLLMWMSQSAMLHAWVDDAALCPFASAALCQAFAEKEKPFDSASSLQVVLFGSFS